jgi:hypothetical protein
MLGERGFAAALKPRVIANPDDDRVRPGGDGLVEDESDGLARPFLKF